MIVLSLLVPVFLGVTGIFWAAPAADIPAIAITAVLMVRLWKQLSKAQSGNVAENVLSELPTKEGVVVTSSREHGSVGKRIGQLVAESANLILAYVKSISIRRSSRDF